MNNWLPSIEVETNQGVREISLYSKLLSGRNVFLNGEINQESANQILAQLIYLQSEDEKAEINLYINSGGGEVTSGLMIYDALQSMKAPVNVYCTGIAASMAAVILAGGQKGRRYILPHSKTMIHEPLINGGVGGSASSIKSISDSILETREVTNGLLAKHTGHTIEEINELTSHDHYMNATQSVQFGICDEVRERFF